MVSYTALMLETASLATAQKSNRYQNSLGFDVPFLTLAVSNFSIFAFIRSKATKAKGCLLLENTKKCFTKHFQEDWNEELWKRIGLADLVKEGRDSFICGITERIC
jgi:hypothetical protein